MDTSDQSRERQELTDLIQHAYTHPEWREVLQGRLRIGLRGDQVGQVLRDAQLAGGGTSIISRGEGDNLCIWRIWAHEGTHAPLELHPHLPLEILTSMLQLLGGDRIDVWVDGEGATLEILDSGMDWRLPE